MIDHKNPSASNHSFAQVPTAEIPRSVFDRKRSVKTMFNSGYLIPFMIDEVLPGDTFNVNATLFVRMPSALSVPIMDNLYLDTFYFYVPNRLLWVNWQKLCGEQINPNDSISFTTPQIVAPASTGWAAESLSDYFGLPIGVPGISVSALWHRAYNLIWNQWFRDENLQNSVNVNTADSTGDNNADYTLLKRGKRHDYFTSALPWAQKGTGVGIGLTGVLPVQGFGKGNSTYLYANQAVYESGQTSGTKQYAMAEDISNATANTAFYVERDPINTNYPRLRVDLGTGTAVTINSLRQAFQIQKMLERDARGGTRYTEIILSHFGVTSPDARLQRAEFLGGRSTPLNISSVPQTSASNAQPTPAGNLSAFALGLNSQDGFVKSFTEHGVILGICTVRAPLTYQQGIDKMFLRSTRYDYYWPALSHLGEQAVLNKEIYAQGTGHETDDEGVFGYQERYAEYRYAQSRITGKLRSTYSTPLDMWHLSQKFISLPTLSSTFIQETPPISRIVAVQSEPEFVLDAFINCKCVRPMPTYSIPGMIDHF